MLVSKQVTKVPAATQETSMITGELATSFEHTCVCVSRSNSYLRKLMFVYFCQSVAGESRMSECVSQSDIGESITSERMCVCHQEWCALWHWSRGPKQTLHHSAGDRGKLILSWVTHTHMHVGRHARTIARTNTHMHANSMQTLIYTHIKCILHDWCKSNNYCCIIE